MRFPKSVPAARLAVVVIGLLLFALNSASGASDNWTGTISGSWTNGGNWLSGNPPQAGDSLFFGSSATTLTLNNDFPALTAFYGLTFNGGSAFTLNGNSVLLSGALITGNSIGVANSSGLAQTIGTMPLSLDWGYYTFASSAGTIALNKGVSLNLGSVAYFDLNNTSSSLTNDPTTGLISGLEGAGFIYDGNFTPTGLATMTGTSIAAYTGYTPFGAGAIANGNNLNLTASGSPAAYTDNNVTVNSISVAQVGNSGGTATTTLTTTGTLTLGSNGGIYLLGNTLGNKGCLSVTGGNLTAGSSGPATITFAINGNNANNQASVSSLIKNNAGGGAVTVIKTGPGSMNFATAASTYTGGVYVNQGQLQFGMVQQVGTGPVYVAGNASLYFTGTGTITNDFYLSSGNGSPTAAAFSNAGALDFAGSGSQFLIGTIHLMGAPVSQGTAGARISGNLSAAQTAFFQGQITGTGTLDFNVSPHAANFVLSNLTANVNNWQGGMILEEVLANPTSARNLIVKLDGNNQIPSGASAGDVTLFSADVSSQHSIVRLDLNGFNASINGLNGAFAPFPVQVSDFGTANSTLTLGNNNASGSYAGIFSDNGNSSKCLSIVKVGSGTQTLSGVNTYIGSTTISNGTLALANNGSTSGSIATSPAVNIASAGVLDGTGIGGFTVASSQTVFGIGTIAGSTTINGAINPFFGGIGTLSNNGNVTFPGGGTYIWNMNNATGTAGSDPGWSLLNVTGGGTLSITANSGSPFTIKITSLSGDVPGNAANFNPSSTKSWVIAKSTVPISGFTASAFVLDTSGFSNPLGSGAFSIALSGDQLSLVLTFTGTPAITTPLVNQTNNAGSTAVFTVVANGATPPITFQWLQGATILVNGGMSASGGTVTIINSGHTSTLYVTNVQDADAGGFTVNVSDTLGDSGSSSATLTVIDPPSGLSVAQSAFQSASPNYVNEASGGIITLTATSGGTSPLTFIFSLNGVSLATNTTGIYNINVSPGAVGTYTVVASNDAGSATNNSVVITPVTESPNQIVYEPFNYQVQVQNVAPWTAFGVTNVFNQDTGEGLSWLNSGTATQPATLAQDMRVDPTYNNPTFSPNGDSYPWPGLAGNSPNEVYCNVNSFMRLPLGAGGSVASGSVYFSAITHVDQGSSIGGVGNDYFCGFGTGSGTTPNTGIYITTPGNDTYTPGAFKTSAGTAGLSPGVNGNWSSKVYHRGQIVFMIMRLNINPGTTNDTFDLWLAPPTNTFGASESSLPTPDVTGGANAPDVGNVDFFYIRNSAATGPISRRYADVRIGTTWASVTPPSAPTLSLANQTVNLGDTATFTSQNAGNPAISYSWSFNGGPPLSDNSHYAGTSTDTLIITNVQAADLGTYTVTAMNLDPITSATLTGSASATLSVLAPVLQVFLFPPDALLEWPTNFSGYTLEQSPSVGPTIWTTNSSPPYTVSGTNYVVTNVISGTKFFRLKK